jgi:hypothetical protein
MAEEKKKAGEKENQDLDQSEMKNVLDLTNNSVKPVTSNSAG